MLKKTVSGAARLLGYEIGRKGGNTTSIAGYEIRRRTAAEDRAPAELSGLDFDHFLHYYFAAQNLSDFFFIQVGANDGVSNDCLYRFAVSLDLRGVLVEPQRSSFDTLKDNYRDCGTVSFENVAVSGENGTRELYTIRKDLAFLQYANQAASFDRSHIKKMLERHLSRGADSGVKKELKGLNLSIDDCIEAEVVETRTFTALLDKYGVSTYDFLQIDTEGFDYEVIKLAGIDRYRPTLLNYEHAHLSRSDRRDCWAYLSRTGYHLFTHGDDTTAYRLQ